MREPRYYESDNDRRTSTAGGVGLTSLLTVAFVILKLCGVIDWSWWWVLAPTWIPMALAILLILIVFIWPTRK